MKRVVLACITATVAACANHQGFGTEPELIDVTPPSASANTIVTIDGEHLCGTNGQCATAAVQLMFLTSEEEEIEFEQNTDSSIAFIVPSFVPIGPTKIVVMVNGVSTNELAFTVAPR